MSLHSDTIKRLVKDIKYLKKNPLHDNNIYYQHDDENIMKGYAMIIGPSDTIYRNGLYFFSFEFPNNYPYSPPKVIFHTNHNNIRMHPNFYRCGKVCLSILNTWSGEKWSSCQSIHSVLLTISSSFTNDPLKNEPYVKNNDFEKYNKDYNVIVGYTNIQYAYVRLCDISSYSSNTQLLPFLCFEDEIQKHFDNTIEEMIKYVTMFSQTYSQYDKTIVNMSIYKMNLYIYFKTLIEQVKNAKRDKNECSPSK